MPVKSANKFSVIGLMSGTSLDGLDVAYCTFEKRAKWTYGIQIAETIKYSAAWKKRLSAAHTLSGEELAYLDSVYGKYLGQVCSAFIRQHRLSVDFISSHGHTVFHQPARGFTLQIGNGNAIHAVTDLPVVYDFRSLDVLLGGEGAPLVPVGDKLLFYNYDVCLNMGGIANISLDLKNDRVAFDVCFCNTPLNYLAKKAGKELDRDGALAKKGEVNESLLARLSRIYRDIKSKRPSLGREIFEKRFQPHLDRGDISLNDRLRTCVESTAREIVTSIKAFGKNRKVLCTGGGALNPLLIVSMLEHAGDDLTFILPDKEVINFKEALVFAFLGVLRATDDVNCLRSVTRASRDSSTGVLVGF